MATFTAANEHPALAALRELEEEQWPASMPNFPRARAYGEQWTVSVVSDLRRAARRMAPRRRLVAA